MIKNDILVVIHISHEHWCDVDIVFFCRIDLVKGIGNVESDLGNPRLFPNLP